MDGNAGEGRLGRWLDNSPVFSRIKGRAMTGADEQLLRWVVVDGAACVGADGIVGDELAAIETHENARITIRGNGEVDRAIIGNGISLRDDIARRASAGRGGR